MRRLPALALLMLATPFTAAAQTPQQPTKTVYLNAMVLEELKTSNPAHYERAVKVIDETSKPCEHGAWQSRPVPVQRSLSPECSTFALQTSNPPKRQVSFVVDDTLYIANVVLKQTDARVWRLEPAPRARDK